MKDPEKEFEVMKIAFAEILEPLTVVEIEKYGEDEKPEAVLAVAETLAEAGAIMAMKEGGYIDAEHVLKRAVGRLPTIAQAYGKHPLSPPPAVESMPAHDQERLIRSVLALYRTQTVAGVKPQHMAYTLLTVGVGLVYQLTGQCSRTTALIVNSLAEIVYKEPMRFVPPDPSDLH